MAKVLHAIWRFFASIKLALISLFILAGISVIGTVINLETQYIGELTLANHLFHSHMLLNEPKN